MKLTQKQQAIASAIGYQYINSPRVKQKKEIEFVIGRLTSIRVQLQKGTNFNKYPDVQSVDIDISNLKKLLYAI